MMVMMMPHQQEQAVCFHSVCLAPERGAAGHSGEKNKKQRSAEEVETFVARLLKCNFNHLILSSFFMYLGYLHPN